MKEILEILEENAKVSTSEISAMTDMSEKEVEEKIQILEKEKVILGYKAMVNWEKTNRDLIMALIDIQLAPQTQRGFDIIAKKIYKYPQVKSCWLVSGSYDLSVMIEGRDLRELSMFVSEKLALIDGIERTKTNFVLKTYKDANLIFGTNETHDREAIIL